jgi:polysaccharide deacetylase 2 family uncharacterized protein YibQ
MTSSNSYSNDAFGELIELNPSYGDEIVIKPEPIPEAPVRRIIPSAPPGMHKIAIIIDDMGYNYAQGVKAIALPGAITYAIIPHSPKADFFALEAQKHHKEVMLHAPMSNVHNIPLGKNGLYEGMNETRFKEALNLSLDSMPSASGVNNHMGSLLTQKALPMEWVMQALQKRRLYFIDSRTTSNSVAWKTAQTYNIPSLKRDIFLDHTPTPEFIDKQFSKLINLAKHKGYAVAIAHPYPETIRYLKQQLPLLAKQNIALVSASELVFDHSPNLMPPKYTNNVTQITETLLK